MQRQTIKAGAKYTCKHIMVNTCITAFPDRSLWNLRSFIHINLCVSLSLAQLTFVIGVTPHDGGEGVGPGCRTAAVIMHYLFLVSFMWMLMEGVVLYVGLVKVFVTNTRKYMTGFLVFSYGKRCMYYNIITFKRSRDTCNIIFRCSTPVHGPLCSPWSGHSP